MQNIYSRGSIMNMRGNIKEKVLLVFIFVFFFTLFMIYGDPLENVFLLISLLGAILIGKDFFKNSSLRNTFFITSLVIITYILSIVLISTYSYEMKLTPRYSDDYLKGKAVLLVYEGESDRYNMSKSLNNILSKDNFVSKAIFPFLLNEKKSNYEKIGKSDYKEETISVKERLEEVLSEEYKTYIGYLYDTKYIEETLIDIVNDGYHNIIIVPVLLTEGKNLSSLKTRIEKMKLYNLNIELKYTEVLWNSNNVAYSFVRKIQENIERDKVADVGIVLIGEGEKEDDGSVESIKKDFMFRSKIKTFLVDDVGIAPEKIKLGWYRYIEPKYKDEVKELFEYGVGSIICIYTKPAVTNIENKIIVEKLKRGLELPERVDIKVIDGFLKDQNLVFELKNRIEFANLQKWN